jgi:antirestriction protein ArdC
VNKSRVRGQTVFRFRTKIPVPVITPRWTRLICNPAHASRTAEYYSTLFHEFAHSTGHPSRLKREGISEAHFFGDAVYSREELVAEMGAAFLCGHTGIESVTALKA